MQQITSLKQMQAQALQFKREGKKIALVPTMGALHEGHLKLVEVARQEADVVVMSIFVNPTQFGPGEDFEQYPRDLAKDAKLALEKGVDILFLPEVSEIYPEGDQTQVIVTELTRGLCGPFRPGHFRGVTTVVAKLFLIVQPDQACFGEKDYQQLKVIERMVSDLHFPVQIIAVPTLREADGLARSSRNVYLKPEDRVQALKISQAIFKVQESVAGGQRKVSALIQIAKEILSSAPDLETEYLEIVDTKTLEPLEQIQKEARVLIAAHLPGVRLIDNGALSV